MKFTDKLKKHESERAGIVATIVQFCDWIIEVGEEMGISYRLWSKDYHSKYLNHFLQCDDMITVNFEYIDPHEDILDTQDTLTFPVEWLDMFEKDKDGLLTLIQKEYTEYDTQMTEQEKKKLEAIAKALGYKLVKGEDIQ